LNRRAFFSTGGRFIIDSPVVISPLDEEKASNWWVASWTNEALPQSDGSVRGEKEKRKKPLV